MLQSCRYPVGLCCRAAGIRSAYVAGLQVSRSVRLGVGEELGGSSIGCVGLCGSGMFQLKCVCCCMSVF